VTDRRWVYIATAVNLVALTGAGWLLFMLATGRVHQ
jgi:hypothetical protein